MTFLFLLLAGGLLLIFSGVAGKTLAETLWGELGSRSGPGGLARVFDVEAFRERTEVASASGGSGGMVAASTGSAQGGARGIVDQGAEIGRRHGLRVISAYRPGAVTTSGNQSDHSGNDASRAARDLSNGSRPTPQMDRAVEEIAAAFGTRVNGKRSVVKTWTWHGYRLQLLYRTDTGGNHFNHIHFGARKA